MKLTRFVVIDCTTNKIVARYTKEAYQNCLLEELSKQETIFGGKTVEGHTEVWENNKCIEKSYEDNVKTGEYFTSPKPTFYNNETSISISVEKSERKKQLAKRPPAKRKKYVLILPSTDKVLARFSNPEQRDELQHKIEKGHTILKAEKLRRGCEVWQGKEILETIPE